MIQRLRPDHTITHAIIGAVVINVSAFTAVTVLSIFGKGDNLAVVVALIGLTNSVVVALVGLASAVVAASARNHQTADPSAFTAAEPPPLRD